MTTPLGAARAVTKIPAQDLDRAVADLRSRGLEFATFEMPGFEVTDQNVVAPDNYPSKGMGERGTFFFDSEGNPFGLAQPTR